MSGETRGDVPGSLADSTRLPEPNSLAASIVASRLTRLRWALVDERTMLAQVHRAQGDVEPVHAIDLQALQHAINSLERVIRHLRPNQQV